MEVLRHYPREVLTAMGARFAENVAYYIFTIVVTTYATKQLGLSSSFVLGAVLIGAAVHLVTIPMWGALSDRFGRRPIYLVGAAGVGVWAFAFIALLDTRSFGAHVLAVVVGLIFHGAMYGPQAAFLSELFGTRVRYSGVSIGYQLASILAGGLAPIIAVAPVAATGTGYASRCTCWSPRWSRSRPWRPTARPAAATWRPTRLGPASGLRRWLRR